jgi:hypothetical protein
MSAVSAVSAEAILIIACLAELAVILIVIRWGEIDRREIARLRARIEELEAARRAR